MKNRIWHCSSEDMKEQGECENFISLSNGCLKMNPSSFEASYVSDVIDSGKIQMEWDSLHFHFQTQPDMEVYIWVLDDSETITSWKQLSYQDRYNVLLYEGRKETTQDVLLYGSEETKKGRYLCFAIHVRKPIQEDLIWEGFEVVFPKVCFSEYLPTIYQNNDDLNRCLAVFKELYLTMEEQVDHFGKELNPYRASLQHVSDLIKWMGLDKYEKYLDVHKQRDFLSFYGEQQIMRGTSDYYKHMIAYLFHQEVSFFIEDMILKVQVKIQDERIKEFLMEEVPFYLQIELYVQEDHSQAILGNNSALDCTCVMR